MRYATIEDLKKTMSEPLTPTIDVLDVDCIELDFQGHALRLTEDLNWVAEDVCLALRLGKTAWSKVPVEFRDLVRVHVGRRGQGLVLPEEVQTVNQDGIEYLISLASKQTALQFQKWLYKEALPSLSKAA
jgi:prophage antirepressor-like protein